MLPLLYAPGTEPMIPFPFPDLLWWRVGIDLFEWKKFTYFINVEYYSKFIKVAKLVNTPVGSVILRSKKIFLRHGIHEEVVTDNKPQFHSNAFRKLAREYQFHHITRSPYYPRGNGEAECGVKTVQKLLKKSDELYLALLVYRSTPLANGHAPAKLMMSRRLRTNVPISREAQRLVYQTRHFWLIGRRR